MFYYYHFKGDKKCIFCKGNYTYCCKITSNLHKLMQTPFHIPKILFAYHSTSPTTPLLPLIEPNPFTGGIYYKQPGVTIQKCFSSLFAETVFDDVAFGLKNFFPNLSTEEVIERVKSAINLVGLDYEKVKEKSPFDLSGGQKRRVAIAGVIVSRPEVLVLDEPVAGLDPKGKREFVALLKSLHNSFVKTIIIVSHDMNLVSENCNKVAVFKKGQIIKTGTPKEIFSDKEMLCSCGLELCSTAFLTEKLKEVGINVDSNLTIDDFIKAYLDAKGVKL